MDLPHGVSAAGRGGRGPHLCDVEGVVEARLTALGTGVRYLVSDRAKALIQLAEQGLECLSMPDFFHCHA